MAVRILGVDDEAQNRRFMRRILEPRGYQVMEAADGEEALARVRQRPYDAVICDLKMPRVDGMMLYRAMAAATPPSAFRWS